MPFAISVSRQTRCFVLLMIGRHGGQIKIAADWAMCWALFLRRIVGTTHMSLCAPGARVVHKGFARSPDLLRRNKMHAAPFLALLSNFFPLAILCWSRKTFGFKVMVYFTLLNSFQGDLCIALTPSPYPKDSLLFKSEISPYYG